MDSETENKDPSLGLLIRALEPSVDALEIADLKGNIAYVNPSWSHLFELDGQGVADASWDLVGADGVEYIEVENSWKRCIEEGTSQGQFVAAPRDGTKRGVSYTRTLCRDPDGVAFAVVTIYRAISETATNREPSRLLVALLERRRGGVAVLDEDGSVIAANEPFAELIGYEGQRIRGRRINTIMPDLEEIKSLVSQGVVWWSGDVDVTRQTGSSISTWMSMDTVKDPRGQVVGFILRTDPRGNGAIPGQELNAASRNRLNRLVHDMRNIFTAIELNLYVALGIGTDQAMHRRLVSIRDASRNGIELLDKVHH